MNIAKRVLCILICLAMLLPTCGVVFAAGKTANYEVVANETFDQHPTYSIADMNLKGFRTRVEEYGDRNKVLAIHTDKANQGIKLDGIVEGKNYFVSFDVLVDGPVTGNIFVYRGTTDNSILTVSNGSIATHNGNRFAGLSKTKFTNVVVEVNAKSSTYSVYIDGKKRINNYYNDKAIDAIGGFGIYLKSEEYQTVLIDNMRIVAGKYSDKIAYEKVEYNEESPADPGLYEAEVTSDVYMNYGWEPDERKYTMNYYNKEHALEQYKREDGNTAVRFARNGNGDMHLDITDPSIKKDVSTSIVYEYDLWLEDKNGVQFNFPVKDSNNQYIYFYRVGDGAVTQTQGGSASAPLPLKQWNRIAVVYNWYNSYFDLWVNGECISKNSQTSSALYNHEIGSIFRFHVPASSSKTTFYVDNMRIYGGSAPREDLTVTEGGNELEDTVLQINAFTIFDNEQTYVQQMADKASYHPLTGVAYYNKNKKMLPRMEKVDGIDMGSAEFFNFVYGAEIKADEATGAISIAFAGKTATMTAGSKTMNVAGLDYELPVAPYIKNGVVYVPIEEVARRGFGKKTFIITDETSNTGDIKANPGAILVSDKDIFVSDSEQQLNSLCAFLAFYRPSPKEIQDAYEASPRKGIHPRVMATQEDFDRMFALVQTDEYMKKNMDALLKKADEWCNAETRIYELRDGVRLWYVSQEYEQMAKELAIAYKYTGDKKYLDTLWRNTESVANFPDWHTEHHIDTGALAIGLAIAYDWCYYDWTEEQREIILKGAKKNGFSVYIDGLEGRNSGMYGGYRMDQNHNCVMTSGGAALAAAFADDLPEICAYVEAGMIRSHEYMAKTFAPDGQWYEGTNYAGMTYEYTSQFFAITEEIWGNLYGMDYSEGTPEAGDYTFHMENGKTGGFGFYDGETKNLHGESGIFWWANHYEGKKYLGRLVIVEHKKGNPWTSGLSRPRGMLWYDPQYWDAEIPDFATSVHFKAIDVVTARDRWKNTQAFFAVKGAKATDTHGHMDATHFVFHSGGTSWEELPGTSNYNVDGWWDYTGVQGKRWQFYVARAEGHNTTFIDPIPEEAEYLPDARVRFDDYRVKPRGVITSANTTDLHNGKALKARRGYFFTDDRRSLVVRDEITVSKEREVYTVFHSAYKPTVDGNVVTLKNGPEELKIEFISNKPLEIFVGDHNSMFKDSDLIVRAGTGYNIYAKVKGTGDITITAKYTPNLCGNPTPITDYDKPISEWTIPDGEIPDVPTLDTLTVGGKELNIETSNTFTVDVFDTNVPETVATSSKYQVELTQATDVRQITGVKVIDPADPKNFAIYSVGYRRVGAPVGFADVEEYKLAGFEASAVPEPHNGPANLFDRNLDTRWSADKEQHMLVDLGEVKPVDTVMIAFYNGKSRSYNIWIEVSADGKNFTRVLDGAKSAGDTTDYERFSFPVQNARYVKVCGNGSNVNEWNSWADMSIGISK